MSLDIAAITFDCESPSVVAAFWAAAFGRPIDPGPEEQTPFFQSIGRSDPQPGANTMMFIKVPEAKTAKNRVHLDLQASDRAAEVERLVDLGATVLHDNDEWGTRWTTLSDPEGNEFCVATH